MKKINKQESPQWFEDWKEKYELEIHNFTGVYRTS